jgi:hypothetical protein
VREVAKEEEKEGAVAGEWQGGVKEGEGAVGGETRMIKMKKRVESHESGRERMHERP